MAATARSTTARRSLAAALCALLVGLLFPFAVPGPASAAPTPAANEATFLTLINQERTRAGLAPLVSDGVLAGTSRAWSGRMAAENRMYHDPGLAAVAALVEPAWRSIGENVGYGGSASSLHTAFMNSPGHRANVMGGAYNRVGIGVVHAGSRVWVTVRFLAGPAIAGPTGLNASTPPPTTTTTLRPLPVTPVRGIDNACPLKASLLTPFTDLIGNTHATNVACAVLWDLADGVSPTRYAPGADLTRGQLASFVARMVASAGRSLPANPSNVFVDDGSSVHQRAINQLAALGIVNGRTDTTYEPNRLVTRAEMASIIVRAHYHLNGTALPAGVDRFRDDETSVHEGAINMIATAGIAAGNTASTFAPKTAVTRGQMATFLTRTIDLLVAAGAVPRR